jgi:hypothetical protein
LWFKIVLEFTGTLLSMDNDGADAGTNSHGGDMSAACLVAYEGSLGPSDVDRSGGLVTQSTSGALVVYHMRSKRMCLEKETYEPQAEIPEDVASFVKTVRPVGRLPPRLMAVTIIKRREALTYLVNLASR